MTFVFRCMNLHMGDSGQILLNFTTVCFINVTFLCSHAQCENNNNIVTRRQQFPLLHDTYLPLSCFPLLLLAASSKQLFFQAFLPPTCLNAFKLSVLSYTCCHPPIFQCLVEMSASRAVSNNPEASFEL
jgi:hypothetical protein